MILILDKARSGEEKQPPPCSLPKRIKIKLWSSSTGMLLRLDIARWKEGKPRHPRAAWSGCTMNFLDIGELWNVTEWTMSTFVTIHRLRYLVSRSLLPCVSPEAVANHVNISRTASHHILVSNTGIILRIVDSQKYLFLTCFDLCSLGSLRIVDTQKYLFFT